MTLTKTLPASYITSQDNRICASILCSPPLCSSMYPAFHINICIGFFQPRCILFSSYTNCIMHCFFKPASWPFRHQKAKIVCHLWGRGGGICNQLLRCLWFVVIMRIYKGFYNAHSSASISKVVCFTVSCNKVTLDSRVFIYLTKASDAGRSGQFFSELHSSEFQQCLEGIPSGLTSQ